MDRLVHRTLTQIHSVLTDFVFCSSYPYLFDESALDKNWKESQTALRQLRQWASSDEEYRYLVYYVNEAIESRDVEYILDELQTILGLQ